jgi:hypothetical protein
MLISSERGVVDDATTGWTVLAKYTGLSCDHSVLWRRATDSEGTEVHVNLLGSINTPTIATIYLFRGCQETGTPFDDNVDHKNGLSWLADVTFSPAPEHDNCMMIFFPTWNDNSTHYAVTSGWTNRNHQSTTLDDDHSAHTYTKLQGSKTTEFAEYEVYADSSDKWSATMVALMPAGSVEPPEPQEGDSIFFGMNF